MRYKRALLVIGLAVGLAGCDSTAASPQETVPATTATRKLMFEDTGLRDVRMTSGRALRYVQPETASQILCQLLEKDEWEELLDGRVGRRAYPGPTATCHVAFSQGMVAVELTQSDDAFEGDTTIAGRPAAIDVNGWYRVALTDEALEPAPFGYFPERRLLTVDVNTDDEDAKSEIAEKVIEGLVPLLTEEGEPLPDFDDRGYLDYADTPPTDDFVDLPTPVQALQLCTALLEEGDVDATEADVEVRSTGECRAHVGMRSYTLAARNSSKPDSYTDDVAGRPATISSWVAVLLRDDAGVELWVSGPAADDLAEKVVPALTG